MREGHAHLVSFFLHYGSIPNEQDKSANTALHYAAAYGWYHCIKLLLKAGANPDTPNNEKVCIYVYLLCIGNRVDLH